MDLVAGIGGAAFAGLTASFVAGIATGIGAIPVLAIRRVSTRTEDISLAFAGGIMLAAAMFSLIIPGLEQAKLRYGSDMAAACVIASALMAGALVVWIIHAFLPHEHAGKGREGPDAGKLRRVWLLVFAISLHNLPEGLAVGVGAAAELGGASTDSRALMLAIGAQNMPEGLIVALALVTTGMSRRRALLAALGTGLVEPIAGTIGAIGTALSAALLPWALGLAAGTMLYVISNEIVPETHARGNAGAATFALLAGFAAMILIAGAIA